MLHYQVEDEDGSIWEVSFEDFSEHRYILEAAPELFSGWKQILPPGDGFCPVKPKILGRVVK